MITRECSSRYLNEFFVIHPAIESCYNLLCSILGLLRHGLYVSLLFPHLFHRNSGSGAEFLSTFIVIISRVCTTRHSPSDCGD